MIINYLKLYFILLVNEIQDIFFMKFLYYLIVRYILYVSIMEMFFEFLKKLEIAHSMLFA